MMQVSDKEFEKLLGQALDELPEKYVSRLLEHVVVTWDYEPSPEQRERLKLRRDQSLFGLYEGLPLTQRYVGGTKILPDKITIFKQPMLEHCADLEALHGQVKKTLWHEMAHYFGLDHQQIHEKGGD
jgi:predicted Zn-dependent protease with MMP-like domain